MKDVLDTVALFLTACGIISFVVSLARRQALREGAFFMMDLWTAASLIKLSGTPSWAMIGIVAIIIALRKGLLFSLRHTDV